MTVEADGALVFELRYPIAGRRRRRFATETLDQIRATLAPAQCVMMGN